MQLSRELFVWERYLHGDRLAARVALFIWRQLVLVVPVWVGLAVVRVCISRSVPDFLASLVGLLPQYSAGTAGFLLARRTAHLAALTRRVRLLAEATEQEQAALGLDLGTTDRYAALVRFVRRAFTVYMTTGMSMIVTQQLLAGPVAPTVGEQGGHIVHVLVHVNETVKWTFYPVSYFALWVTIATALLALNALYDVLQRRVARARAHGQVLAAARLHRELLAVQAELKDMTFTPLLHVLAGSLAVPLINTYQILRGIANVFSLLTFSTLPFVFGTLSLLADGLEVRSERLSLAVHAGVDVLGEALATSKLRLMLIARAGGHQGQSPGLSMRAFGPLNRRAAFAALHRWYQYLQLLMGSS